VSESVGDDVIETARVSVRELMSALSSDEAHLLADD